MKYKINKIILDISNKNIDNRLNMWIISETYMLIKIINTLLNYCNYLDIKTSITSSSDYHLNSGKTERLADLSRQAGGTEYLSGPSAKGYLDKKIFLDLGIKLTWFEYSGSPPYQQLWGGFSHGVTILDLLFNCGKDSPHYMRYLA